MLPLVYAQIRITRPYILVHTDAPYPSLLAVSNERRVRSVWSCSTLPPVNEHGRAVCEDALLYAARRVRGQLQFPFTLKVCTSYGGMCCRGGRG